MSILRWESNSPKLPDGSPVAKIVLSKSMYSSSKAQGFKQRLRGAARDFVGSVLSEKFLSMWCTQYCLFFVMIIMSSQVMHLTPLHPLFLILVLGAIVGSFLLLLILLLVGVVVFLANPEGLLNLYLFPDQLNLYSDRFIFFWTKQGKKQHVQIDWSWVKKVRLNDYLYMGVIPVSVLKIELKEAPSGSAEFALIEKISGRGVYEDPSTKKIIPGFPLAGITIPLPLFGFAQDIELLLQTIREKSGEDVIDQSVLDKFETTNLESFTSMWLSELSSTHQDNLERQLSPGTQLRGGAYTITGILGHGGFSVVYAATEGSGDDKPIAIKEIVCNFGGTNRSVERNLRQMLHEASVLARLDHPNIVRFHHCFAEGNRLYIVMEALCGVTLRNYRFHEPTPNERQLLDIAEQCCLILDYLHSHTEPIVHRDFTPDNLMFSDGVVKLVDFNIAQSTITSSSGTVVGKHCYMATEQFCGEYTVRGDLYQLGATLYFLATGEDPEPFGPCNLRGIRSDLSDSFHDFVERLTDQNPNNRPASATESLQMIRSPAV